MLQTLKDKAEQLIHCIRLAKALGYEDVEYTSKGYSLMKHNRVVKPFSSTDEAEQWLEQSFERNARYDTIHFAGKLQVKPSGYKELSSRMNECNYPNVSPLLRITGIKY